MTDWRPDTQSVAITLGALAPPIGEQIPELDEGAAHHFQQDADALNRLRIRGVLSRSEANRAGSRLVKAIARELCGTPEGQSPGKAA